MSIIIKNETPLLKIQKKYDSSPFSEYNAMTIIQTVQVYHLHMLVLSKDLYNLIARSEELITGNSSYT